MSALGGVRRETEAGFTLVEILVVMLILGLLAAIAVPAYFAQRDKAHDSEAKVYVRSAQTAIESFATDHDGRYSDATVDALQAIEPSLNGVPDANIELSVGGLGIRYGIAIISATGNKFSVQRGWVGSLQYACEPAGEGGCPASGVWG